MKFQNISIHGSNLFYAHENNKWPKIVKGHNSQQNFIKLAENLNQVISSSVPIGKPNIKALAQIFFRYLANGISMLFY